MICESCRAKAEQLDRAIDMLSLLRDTMLSGGCTCDGKPYTEPDDHGVAGAPINSGDTGRDLCAQCGRR